MVDKGRRGGRPLTGLTGALNSSVGSSGAPAPRRGAHFESLSRALIDAQAPVLAADVPVEHQGSERKAGAQGEQRRTEHPRPHPPRTVLLRGGEQRLLRRCGGVLRGRRARPRRRRGGPAPAARGGGGGAPRIEVCPPAALLVLWSRP